LYQVSTMTGATDAGWIRRNCRLVPGSQRISKGTDRKPSPNFKTFKEPQESIPRINSANLCSLAARYDNPIPTRFLVPIVGLKLPPPVTILHLFHVRRIFLKLLFSTVQWQQHSFTKNSHHWNQRQRDRRPSTAAGPVWAMGTNIVKSVR
jgi:hypothetical protein